MKVWKRFITVLISLLFITFPPQKMDSCGPDFDTEDARLWLFLPNLVNQEAMIPFTYSHDWMFNSASNLDFKNDEHLYKKLNLEHYAVNVKEWAQVVPNVKSEDIYKALYEVNSDMFCSQLESNSFDNNSFINALQKKKDLWEYFLIAKECEHYFAGSGWADPKVKDKLTALPAKIEKILRGTKNPFIRQRTAYQLIKAYEYTEQQDKGLKIFDEFFKKDTAAQKSWVYGHACYHYARANDSFIDTKWLYFARAFRLAPDKRYVTMLKLPLDFYDGSDINFFKTELKSSETTDADRMAWATIKALRYPGRSLTMLQKIYRSEPNNKEFLLLIEREINKIEDWLFTNNSVTDYYGSRLALNTEGVHRVLQEKKNTDDEYKPIQKAEYERMVLANRQSDLAYLQELSTFIEQVAKEGKSSDKTFINLAAAHLSFMRKDVNKTRQYVAAVRQDTKAPLNIRSQADVTEVLAGIYASSSFDKGLENSIMELDKTMARDTAKLVEGKQWMSLVYSFIADKFIQAGRNAEGCMLLMRTKRELGWVGASFSSINGYNKLFELGKPNDFDQAIQIIEKPNTPFEKFLSSSRKPLVEGKWTYDTYKLRNYKATYYLRHDQWDSARVVLSQIPKSYWQKEPYKSMLYCNPFYVDIQHPHLTVKADSTRFDKLAFVEKVIQLKNEFNSNPTQYARNAYLIGNAYYNCSWHGNSWLMLDLAWGNGFSNSGMYGDDPKAFADNFYRHNKAIEWYEKAAANSADPSLKALSSFMVDWCEKQGFEYWEYKSEEHDDKQPKPILRNVLNQLPAPFAKTDYWCQQYENLAHKYSGY
jgi:hypothetical protein